jgi:hypothetical protein
MTDAELIAKLRSDVDVLTGLVVGLVSLTEMRAQAAVRNYDGARLGGSQVMDAVTLQELALQQTQVLRLATGGELFEGDLATGYAALTTRMTDALGGYALPTIDGVSLAA